MENYLSLNYFQRFLLPLDENDVPLKLVIPLIIAPLTVIFYCKWKMYILVTLYLGWSLCKSDVIGWSLYANDDIGWTMDTYDVNNLVKAKDNY